MFSVILESDDLGSKVYDFDKDEICIGRLSSSDIQLKSNNVSKQHSRIVFREGKYFIIDRKSTNGTFVNGKRVTAPLSLKDGDKIYVGDFMMTFKAGQAGQKKGPKPPPLPERPVDEAADLADKRGTVPPMKEPLDLAELAEEEDTLAPVREARTMAYLAALEFGEFRDTHMHDLDPEDEVLKSKVSEQLRAFLEQGEAAKLEPADKNQIHDAVLAELLGFGALEKYLFDEDVDEVYVNGPERIVASHHGVKEVTEDSFSCEEALVNVASRLAASTGVELDAESSVIDFSLPHGLNVAGVLFPHSPYGSALRISKRLRAPETISGLQEDGLLNDDMAIYLMQAVEAKKTVAVIGATARDRLDLLAALAAAIPERERPALVNFGATVLLPHEDHLVLENAAGEAIESELQVCTSDLLRAASRLSADRIVLRDLREDAALDLLYALNSGFEGSLFSLFGHSAADGLERLSMMAQYHGTSELMVRKLISATVDLVVCINRYRSNQRRVSGILELTSTEQGWQIAPVFAYDVQSDTPTELLGGFQRF
ncbi:MAG: FHA domain-containing protein [Myxococcales bacterium]|nr:MAG: FHA domain-containing protein [Myxococcales bacterium]